VLRVSGGAVAGIDYNAILRRLSQQNQQEQSSPIDQLQKIIGLQGGAGINTNANSVSVNPPPKPRTISRRIERGGGNYSGGSGKVVSVYGIKVDASIADNVRRMLDHARREGVNLGGGGWRSNATQWHLWRTKRHRVPVARPGSSRHERGLAIDFNEGGRSLSNRSFQWLRRNAGRYGFYNLPSERWHWSVDGR
jgi:hypothetical protein